LLTFEAVLLVAIAFATSALGIWLLLRLAATIIPVAVPLDTRVMLFASALAVLVIGATGLLPGLISTRGDTAGHLRTAGRSVASGNSRLRRGLVVAQVTLCFLVLLGGGFFVRGVVTAVGTGQPDAPHTLITELRFDALRTYGPAERRAFVDAFDTRMRADSRVRGIAYISSGQFSAGPLRVWRTGDAPEGGQVSPSISVAGDYFDVSALRVVRGRALTKADAAAMTAVVVNDAFIARFKLTEPVVGQSLRIAALGDKGAAPRHVTIVGVAARPESADTPNPAAGEPTLFLPLGTPANSVKAWIRAGNAAQLADTVRRTLTDLDPDLPAVSVRTLEEIDAENDQAMQTIARTAGGLGFVALLLAISGLYSVVAFFVALRTNEFGIRLALGARSADIVRMVLGQALRLAAMGLVVGAVLGVPLLMALHSNFPFTTRFDPAVILPPAIALALTALIAGWVPARRASSIQASEALRAE
jgi:putative ABC transport system permease protein